jgi:hypothetical protein
MSEEVTNENVADSTDEAATNQTEPETSEAPKVPVRELQKERRERQKLEKELASLQAAQEEARQAELSEVDKLREELNQTKAAAEAAEQARVISEQQSLIRTEASANGFADVSDAITFVDFQALAGLEGSELSQAVKDEVNRVITEKPYLLKQAEETNNRKSLGLAADRDGANEPPATGEDQVSGFVHGLLFGKK